MPFGVAMYAQAYKDRQDWGPSLSFDVAYIEFLVIPHDVYDLRPHVLDVGITADYAHYLLTHPFSRITDPVDPPPSLGGEESDSDDPIMRRWRQR